MIKNPSLEQIVKADDKIHPIHRRVVVLQNGTRKPFIKLKKGDIFYTLNNNGSILKNYNASNNTLIRWYEATSDIYLNDYLMPTISIKPYIKSKGTQAKE